MQAGGVFTASYVLLVLASTLAPPAGRSSSAAPSPEASSPTTAPRRSRLGEIAALALALLSLLLGLFDWTTLLPVSREALPSAVSLDQAGKVLGPLLGGAVLALLLSRSDLRAGTATAMLVPLRRVVIALAEVLVRTDAALRQWTAAGLSLLVLVVLFCLAMLGAH